MGSTTVNLLTSAVSQVVNTFGSLLPQVITPAVILAVLYGILHWILGAGRRK